MLFVYDVRLDWWSMVRVGCCGKFDFGKVVMGVVVVVSNRWWEIGYDDVYAGNAGLFVAVVVVGFVAWVGVGRMMIRGYV